MVADQPRRGRGRPSDYTDELVDEFCRRIASGRSVLSVCGDLDMPDDATIYRWRHQHPDFREKLAQAREERLESDADQIRALAKRVIEDESLDPQRCNAAVNAIDKAARLMAPKQRVELTGRDGGPIETQDVSARELVEGRLARLAAGGGSGEGS
ncbi:MAG: transposase [Rhodovulum sp.]|nr:transposase [Rhodovulum sp.]